MKVLLLGRLRDVAGWREREIAPAPANLQALIAHLGGEDSGLGEALRAPSIKAAVNRALARGNPDLQPSDEVAFMPPMSGG